VVCKRTLTGSLIQERENFTLGNFNRLEEIKNLFNTTTAL
jgi:hypothetical protein